MIVYGRNVAKEMLNSNKKINKIMIQKDFGDKNIISLIENKKIKCEILDKKEFSRFDKFSHQGIILDVEDFVYTDLNEIISVPDATIVILDHLEDPHNLGAIIRTCLAAGVDGIIIPKDRSVKVNSTVMKTSSGAAIRSKICMVTNLNQTIKYLKEKGYWFYAADMNGENYSEIDYAPNTCLIIGNEGSGVSELVKKSSDYIVSIPMKGQFESLNASVATGILIYEVVRQRSH